MNIVNQRVLAAFLGITETVRKPYVTKVRSISGGVATMANGVKIAADSTFKVGKSVLIVPTAGNPIGVIR